MALFATAAAAAAATNALVPARGAWTLVNFYCFVGVGILGEIDSMCNVRIFYVDGQGAGAKK